MQRHSARPARTKAWTFLAIATLCTALACSNLLDVKAPDAISTSSLEDPVNAPLLVQSLIGDFDCAYGSYIVASGLMSGEFQETTLTAARWSYDRRDIDPNETAYSTNGCTSLGTYTPIQTARFTADHALKLLEGWTDDQVPHRTNLIAHAATFGGYDRVLLGEGFCSAAIDLGPQLSSNDIFNLAIQKFDTAVTAAQTDPTNPIGDGDILNLAILGRARAELDAGNNAAAAADAALIPSGFVYYATYDAATDYRTNRVFAENNGHTVTVAARARVRLAVLDHVQQGRHVRNRDLHAYSGGRDEQQPQRARIIALRKADAKRGGAICASPFCITPSCARYMLSTIACANSLVLSSVAPFICRSKS